MSTHPTTRFDLDETDRLPMATTGDPSTPAPRRPASEVTCLDRWGRPVA